MGFRFFRRIRIAPGIKFNLSKRGVSVSVGPRGAKFTVGTRGVRRTLGLPGTGFYYTEQSSWKRRHSSEGRGAKSDLPMPAPKNRLTLGFFERLVTPKGEQHLVAGLAALVKGDEQQALECLEQATDLADGAFLSGVLYLKKGQPAEAAKRLLMATQRKARLGTYLSKYGVELSLRMSITPQVTVEILTDRRGLLLALIEALQELDELDEAIKHLRQLRQLVPDDPVVTLSLIELLMEAHPNDQRIAKKVLDLTENIENESEIHGAMLLFRAKALSGLGLTTAGRTLLTKTLRRRKGRSDELLRSLRYERAIVYESLGEHRRARKDFELVYADDPRYEDVAYRLGIS